MRASDKIAYLRLTNAVCVCVLPNVEGMMEMEEGLTLRAYADVCRRMLTYADVC